MTNPTPQDLMNEWVMATKGGTVDIGPLGNMITAVLDDVLGHLRDSYYSQTSLDGSPIDNAISDAITYFTTTYL